MVPELKISEEEMESCKAKMMEKKNKKKSKRAQEKGEDIESEVEDENEDEEIKAMVSQAKKKKVFHKSSKVKINK